MKLVARLRELVKDVKPFQWLILVGFGLVVGVLLVIVVVLHNKDSKDVREMKKVRAAIGRHVILPTNETPVVATISDPSKVGSNAFLKQGKTGDKLLIYAGWKRAILYRPSEDKVVDIGPVDVTPPGGDESGFNPLK